MIAPQPSEILPHLFVGPAIEATRILHGNKYRIRKVIAVIESPFNAKLEDKIDAVMRLHINNEEWHSLSEWFNDVFEFIDDAIREKRNVLVHCMNGQNRSVALVIAYLMSRKLMSFEEAYNFIKEKHETAKLSSGFERRLREYVPQYTSSL